MADKLPTTEIWTEGDWDEVLDQPAEYAAKGGDAGKMTWERIRDVIWLTADSIEGYSSVDMACVVTLTDGSCAICEAWCDTTGWGCRDGVTWKVGPTLETVVSELSPDYRDAFTKWQESTDG
jgi:hypothetical protein